MVEVCVYSEVRWLLSTSFHRLHWNTVKSRCIAFRYIHRTHQRNVTVRVDVLYTHFRASHDCQNIKLAWYLWSNTDHPTYPIIMSFSSLYLYNLCNFFVIWRFLDEVPLLRNYYIFTIGRDGRYKCWIHCRLCVLDVSLILLCYKNIN